MRGFEMGDLPVAQGIASTLTMLQLRHDTRHGRYLSSTSMPHSGTWRQLRSGERSPHLGRLPAHRAGQPAALDPVESHDQTAVLFDDPDDPVVLERERLSYETR